MSVQDIVEAYETRLRERWTPDGERLDLKTRYEKAIAHRIDDFVAKGAVPFPLEIMAKNTREICGND